MLDNGSNGKNFQTTKDITGEEMYIIITKQNKYSKEVEVYEGGWDASDYGIAEALRSFYQFNEHYEPIPWIADNLTEDQFNDLYASGQRLFWLEDVSEFMIVKIEDVRNLQYEYQRQQDLQQELKYKEELLDDLICYSSNLVDGFLNQIEFSEITKAFCDFQQNEDKKLLEAMICTIQYENDKRLERERK